MSACFVLISDGTHKVMMKEETFRYVTFLILFGVRAAQHHTALMSPFFFMCNYHTESDLSSLNTGEVAISVTIKDNPEYYIPSELYEGEFNTPVETLFFACFTRNSVYIFQIKAPSHIQ